MRPEDRLKFQVELVWDIYREARDIIVIRVMQIPQDSSEAAVLCYWTLSRFKERLDMMRDCYDDFTKTGVFVGRGDPLEDPWLDPSTVELILEMRLQAETELQRQDKRQALLAGREAHGTSGHSRATAGATSSAGLRTGASPPAQRSGQRHPSPLTPSRVQKGSSATGSRTAPAVSSTHSSIAGGQLGRKASKLRFEGINSTGTSPATSPRQWRYGTTPGSCRPPSPTPSEASRRPPAAGRHAGAPGSSCSSGRMQREVAPPPEPGCAMNSAQALGLPATTPPDSVAGGASNLEADLLIAVLKEQLRDKSEEEKLYRDQIVALQGQLCALEKEHGPLLALVQASFPMLSPPPQCAVAPLSPQASTAKHVLMSAADLGQRAVPWQPAPVAATAVAWAAPRAVLA